MTAAPWRGRGLLAVPCGVVPVAAATFRAVERTARPDEAHAPTPPAKGEK